MMQEFLFWAQFLPLATAAAMVFYGGILLLIAVPAWRQRALPYLLLPAPVGHNFAATEGFRGLAALLIAITHCWQWSQPVFLRAQADWLQFLDKGHKAVPIFVVLSGFLILQAIHRIVDLEGLRVYVLRRFWRIFPVYIVTTVVLILIGQRVTENSHQEFWAILSDVFMLRVFNFPTWGNPVAWSLYVEIRFYVFAPIFVFAFQKRLLLASVIAFLVFALADQPAGREVGLWKYFLIGMIAAELHRRWQAEMLPRWIFPVLFVVGTALLVNDFRGRKGEWVSGLGLMPYDSEGDSIGLALGCLLVLLGTLGTPFISRALAILPLRILGALSYSLFLWHPFWILANFPSLRFTAAGVRQDALASLPMTPAWYMFFMFIPGALLLAAISYVMIERPFLIRRPQGAVKVEQRS